MGVGEMPVMVEQFHVKSTMTDVGDNMVRQPFHSTDCVPAQLGIYCCVISQKGGRIKVKLFNN